MTSKKTAVVLWCFTDGKKGHEKQTLGLIQGLKVHSTIELDTHMLHTNSTLQEQCQLPLPDLIVGAGHATHLQILRSRLIFGGRSIVLMKPTFPATMFDLALVPQHDTCASYGNVCFTEGVLSPSIDKDPDPSIGAILLGGNSRHFIWKTEEIIGVVEEIVEQNPKKLWTICDSRRTPPSLMQQLPTDYNVVPKPWQETSPEFLTELIASSSATWVTGDSVSMLYEALAAQAPVGVIELPLKSSSRGSFKLARGIEKLALKQRVQLSSNGLVLEANQVVPIGDSELRRCAQIIVNRLLLK